MLAMYRNLCKFKKLDTLPLAQLQRYATEVTIASDKVLDNHNLQNNILPEKDKLFKKLEIELRGVDPAVLKSYSWFSTTAANHLGITIGKSWAERKAHHDRLTLLKSVHIFKKHRVQYEIRTYFRYIEFQNLTGSTLDTFLEYIERNLPEGVALKATKTELQKLPDHLKEMPSISTE